MPGIPMSVEKFKELLMNFAKESVALNKFGESLEEYAKIDSGDGLLERCLNSAIAWGTNSVNQQIFEDLSRVEFDWENFYTNPYGSDVDAIMGFWVTESGVPVLGCLAGGDWEYPIQFVLYPESETKLRAYLPTVEEGNVYNTKTNMAYGNEEEEEEPDEDLPSPNINLFKAAVERHVAG